MKRFPHIRVLAALVIGLSALPELRAIAADDEGLALEIVYDTSGSMKSVVRDAKGHGSPKYVIANRALTAVDKQLAAYATNHGTVDVGLIIFEGDGVREEIQLKRFSPGELKEWAGHFASPKGNTPLGKALSLAGNNLLDSKQPRKHVLIITDGANTVEPKPEAVMPKLTTRAQEKNGKLAVHFIAFDVNAKEFAAVKKLGATVVGAADEPQLNAQLDFILQKKILLEDEEPKKK